MESGDEQVDLKGVMWMLASVVLFAGNTLLIRGASLVSAGADGWMATLFRGAFGILILLIFFSNGRGFEWRRMFSNRLVMMRGLIGGVGIICFYITITELGAGRAIVINLTYPMFATVIAAFWLKEKVRLVTSCWLVVAMAGLLVFLSDGNMKLAPSGYDMLGSVRCVGSRFRGGDHPQVAPRGASRDDLRVRRRPARCCWDCPFAGNAARRCLPLVCGYWRLVPWW